MEQASKEDKKRQFGMWLGKPKSLRDPKSQEELADILGVTKRTLGRWKKDPEVLNIAQNYKKLEAQVHLDDVVKVMTEKALNGNAADRRLYLEWLGELDKSKREKTEPLGKIEVEFVTKTGVKNTD